MVTQVTVVSISNPARGEVALAVLPPGPFDPSSLLADRPEGWDSADAIHLEILGAVPKTYSEVFLEAVARSLRASDYAVRRVG